MLRLIKEMLNIFRIRFIVCRQGFGHVNPDTHTQTHTRTHIYLEIFVLGVA